MGLDKMLKIQAEIKELYANDDLVGISDDNIHIRIERFLEEFDGDCDSYHFYKPKWDTTDGEFHLCKMIGDSKIVAVFNDYDIADYFGLINNEGLRSEMISKFGDLNEEN